MKLRARQSGLILELVAPLDPQVAALAQREIDAFGRGLSAWGHFRRPVRVRTVNRADLLCQAASCATQLQMYGLASIDEIILLAPHAWAVTPDRLTLERVFLHELSHTLLFQRCASEHRHAPAALPTWFREGMAQVVADGPAPPGWRRELAGPRLSDLLEADDELLAAHGREVYRAAASCFQAWIERFGFAGLSGLCRAMAVGHGFATAHRKALGVASDSFVSNWLAQVDAEARTG